MDFTKFDFSKFDFTKMFDADAVLTQIENVSRTATGYITDKRGREIADSVTTASIELARAQNQALKAYGEAIKRAMTV